MTDFAARSLTAPGRMPVLHEPATRTVALGPGTSLYLRDPDDNRIESITYGDPKYQ
jgi:hypothetical protein